MGISEGEAVICCAIRARTRSGPASIGRCLAAIGIALVAGLVSAPGQAADWLYRVRPGDNLWELSQEYLRPSIPWERVQTYNRIADPDTIQPGSTLRFPVAWLRIQPAKVRVVAVQGMVSGHDSGGDDSFAVEADMVLGIGVTLTTDAGSNLTLQFADGSRLLIQSGTTLTLDTVSAYGDTGMVDAAMRLQRGRIEGKVIEDRGSATRFVIDTPTASTSVRGTRFRLASDDADRSLAEVLDGAITVRDGDREVMLEAGFGTVVVAGDAPMPPQPLLPAPDLDGIPEAFDRLPLSLSWTPLVDHAVTGYRVQIAPSRRFERLLYDEVADEPRATVIGLPEGELVLRVRGLDERGVEGHDATHAFTVDARPAPPFRITPAEGSTVRQARPRFAWTASEEAVAYRFQLAREDRFDEPILDLDGIAGTVARPRRPLTPGADYSWRVAARDASGRWGPWSDPQRFAFEPLPASPAAIVPEVERGSLTVRWRQADPEQVHRYRIQISRDPEFSDLLVDRELEATEISIPRPPRGTWYLRARAIAADGHAGPFSPTQTVEVACRACKIALIVGGTIIVILVAL